MTRSSYPSRISKRSAARRRRKKPLSEKQIAQLARLHAMPMSAEQRARISASNKQYLADPENRKKVVARLHSPESRRKAGLSNRQPIAVRFARFAHPEPNSGCWLWDGNLSSNGYGIMMINRRKRLVTHISLELDGRPRPFPKANALHSCDNPVCVNPAHLRWGTQKENVADAMKRLRMNLSGLLSYSEWRAWRARGGK